MKYSAFQSRIFRQHVENALKSVKKVLDINRNPKVAEDEDHSYDDKFAFAEFLTNSSIAAQLNLLEQIGMTQDKIEKLHSMIHEDKRSVTVRFEAEDSCQFDKETIADVVQHDSEYVQETTKEKSGIFGGTSTKTRKETNKHKVIKKVKEYHWKVILKYRIFCYAGNDPEKDSLEICSRTASTFITTTGSKTPPRKELTTHEVVETSLTWLFQNMKQSKKQWTTSFKIDRSISSCRTPRRNEEIETAIQFFSDFSEFTSEVRNFFYSTVERDILSSHNPANAEEKTPVSIMNVDTSSVFCPVLPLLENDCNLPGTVTRGENPRSLLVLPSDNTESGESPVLSVGDIDLFLNEQCRTIQEVIQILHSKFPTTSDRKLISFTEAKVSLLAKESVKLTKTYIQCVEYIEYMLKTQLRSAIGKDVKSEDFEEFMRFHSSKLFSDNYRPKPFCYAIRRSEEHYPEGLLSIETASNTEDGIDPSFTFVRHINGENLAPIKIPLNAATELKVNGNRYLHGWMNHRFEDQDPPSYQLIARAHQFSSFILMVGIMTGPDNFTPKDAIVVQNKDEVLIPLLLNHLPSAKEFKDAITSLSPEQQRFARSFRGMQLESSVFGVCVIQLKPQLEKLLGLSDDSLTKEIKLTQDLMSMFIDYQIPSNLLSFDGGFEERSLQVRVDQVKRNIKAVMDMIDAAKRSDLEDEKLMAKNRFYQRDATEPLMRQFDEPEGWSELIDETSGRIYYYNEITGETSWDYPADNPSEPKIMLSKSSRLQKKKSKRKSTTRGGMSRMSARSLSTSSSTRDTYHSTQNMSHEVSTCNLELNRVLVGSTTKTEETPNIPIQKDTNKESNSNKENSSDNQEDCQENFLRMKDQVLNDFTMIPQQLDHMFETHDSDGSIRSTILKTSDTWKRKRQDNLLSRSKKETMMDGSACKDERNKAYDLLDALSRSGSLEISSAELHVVVAVTHQFENDVIGTVVQDNINPIEKVEKAILMLASAIYGVDNEVSNLISTHENKERLIRSFPELFQNKKLLV